VCSNEDDLLFGDSVGCSQYHLNVDFRFKISDLKLLMMMSHHFNLKSEI